MGRILFFVLLAIVIYMLWRSMLRRDGDRRHGARPGEGTPQAMVSCAKCGLHVPRHEALPLGERYFCCEEHRRNASSV